MSLSFCRSEDGLVVLVGGTSYTARPDHEKYPLLVKAVKEGDEKTFLANINEEKVIQNYLQSSPTLCGKAELINGQVTYGGKPIHSTIAQRIIEFKNEGLSFEPMLKFLEKLYQNPSSRAVDELYDFLENKNLPITPEGNFLAYKAVRSDYYSVTAGTLELVIGTVDEYGRIYNAIGETVECKRNAVDDNRDNECSYGIHIGGLRYSGPGGSFTGDRTVIVEVSPADVVAVPKDYSAQKARVCKYTVVGDYVAPLSNTLSTHLHNDEDALEDEDNDWDSYEDEDYDDEFNDDDELEDDFCDDDDCDICHHLDNDDDLELDSEDYQNSKKIKVEQIRDDDAIEFTYKTTKENRRRFMYVESVTDSNVCGKLTEDDVKYSKDSENFRNFSKSRMSDVVLWY